MDRESSHVLAGLVLQRLGAGDGGSVWFERDAMGKVALRTERGGTVTLRRGCGPCILPRLASNQGKNPNQPPNQAPHSPHCLLQEPELPRHTFSSDLRGTKIGGFSRHTWMGQVRQEKKRGRKSRCWAGTSVVP